MDNDGDPDVEQGAFFSEIVRHVGTGVSAYDADGKIHSVNDYYAEMLGIEPEALEAEHITSVNPEFDRAQFDEYWDSFEDGETRRVDTYHQRFDDGSVFPVRVTTTRTAIGGRPFHIGTIEDITERKEREHRLERYERIVENVPIGMYRTTPGSEGEFRLVNPGLVDILGAGSKERLRGVSPADVYVDRDNRERFSRTLREEGTVDAHELHLETFDGDPLWCEVSGVAAREDGETVFDLVLQDVTQRKTYQQELRQGRRTYHQLYSNIQDMVFVHTDGIIRSANVAAKRQLGYETGELEGMHMADLRPEDADRTTDWDDTGGETVEHVLETSDGRRLTVSVTRSDVEFFGEEATLEVARDITQRTEYERRLEEQRDNLDVLNEMVRHDIRNDLQLIHSYADLLTDYVDGEGREHLTTVLDSVRSAIDLTEDARDLAEVMLQTDLDTGRVSLRRALDAQIERVRSAHPDAVVTIDGTLPRTEVVANDMLGSVFRNLLRNAIQHNDSAVPEVTVSAEAGAEADAAIVRIADDGPGVPDAQKEAIFGRGETGIESHGTGIGLYLVQSLVDSYGGDVWVEDNDPEGAVFVVELPTAG